MHGAPRRPDRSSARFFFALPSVLALLALALFPVIAHAESSGEAVYEPEVPSVESKPSTSPGKSVTPHKSTNKETAEGSAVPSEGGRSGEAGSESEGQKASGGVASNGGNNNPPTGGGGEGGGNHSTTAGGTPGDTVSGAQEVPAGAASQASGSSGSSPVVPILVAVVVLAAISIGVVLYRQRQSGEGPDGRVSSPNAS